MLTDDYATLIEEYSLGPRLVTEAVAGMAPIEWDLTPGPGLWSVRQVVVHLTDFALVNADRMKRILTDDRPLLPAGDPDRFVERLAYAKRDVDVELQLLRLVREQMVGILKNLSDADFAREGVHSDDGPVSLAEILRRDASHIPHHLPFIEAKREAMRRV